MPENAKSPSEPSMEEIIASISRIITDEKRPEDPFRPIPSENRDDVFELTEAVNEDGSVRRVTPLAERGAAPGAEAAEAGDPAIADVSAARAEPDRPHSDAALGPKLDLDRERIVSAATSGAAAAAFAQLGALPRERRREGELTLGAADRTLEDIVRDMLRPLLETWLNEHLPGIVDRLVRKEIARVVGEAGLR